MRVLAGLLAGLFTLIAAYAALIEPKWVEVTGIRLHTDSANPVSIVQLSDLHLGSTAPEGRVIETLRELAPDVIVLTGDVVDSLDGLARLPEFLARLPKASKFAVLGNWEHWSGIDLVQLRSRYREAGVTLLVNESRRISIRGRAFYITGLDDDTAGHPTLGMIEAKRPGEARVLLQHSPGYFGAGSERPVARFDLCLAGHTHGGQVTLLGLPIWTPRGSAEFVRGLHDHEMCQLYVSRGLGTSVLPLRLGARPEIVVFEI